MRRLIAAVTMGAAATLAAGCSDGTVTAGPSGAPSLPAGAAPSSPSRDPMARAICDDLQRNVLDGDAKAFGAELGKMITARGQGNKAEEGRAQQAAVAKLGEIAGKLRRHAGEATEPRLKGALTASAANLEKMAAHTGDFASLNSLETIGQTTQKFAASLSDIADYCSA
jgi:hypothetical protein